MEKKPFPLPSSTWTSKWSRGEPPSSGSVKLTNLAIRSPALFRYASARLPVRLATAASLLIAVTATVTGRMATRAPADTRPDALAAGGGESVAAAGGTGWFTLKGTFKIAGAAPAPVEDERQRHVLLRGQARKEVEELEDEADGAAAVPGQAVLVEGGATTVRVVNTTDDDKVVSIPGRHGWLVDLRGRPLQPFETSFPLAPWSIATVRLAP